MSDAPRDAPRATKSYYQSAPRWLRELYSWKYGGNHLRCAATTAPRVSPEFSFLPLEHSYGLGALSRLGTRSEKRGA